MEKSRQGTGKIDIQELVLTHSIQRHRAPGRSLREVKKEDMQIMGIQKNNCIEKLEYLFVFQKLLVDRSRDRLISLIKPENIQIFWH